MDLLLIILFLCLCYFVGSWLEKKHYKSIRQREVALYKKVYVTFGKGLDKSKNIEKTELVSGCVVLACDRFKTFLASLKNLFGGNVSSMESVLDRARREAILRAREDALKNGLNIVINLKIDTIMLDPLGGGQRKNSKVCIIAYGTGIKYAKQ